MVTTMPNGKPNFRLSSITLCLMTGAFGFNSHANDLQVTADIGSSAVYQDIAIEDRENSESATISVEPRVNLLYEGRTIQGRWSGVYTFLERDLNESSRSDNFGRYTYDASWAALEELLVFRVNGALNYQNVNLNGNLVNDFLLNSEELSKIRSNRYAVESTIVNNGYFNAQGTAFFTDTKSERTADAVDIGLDNDSIGASGTISNDDSSERFIWRGQGSYIKTDRSADEGDFVSRQGAIESSYMVIDNWGVTAVARHEANQISDQLSAFGLGREFNSYGVGLTYRQSRARVVTLTANRTDSDIEDNDGQSFVGVNVSWAFSQRTRLNANWGKRIFGDAGDFDFTYNTKHFRSTFGYSEEFTSFSRLISDPTNLGVFVCTNGSTDISNCFQPNSLNYQPQVGEELVQFTAPNLQIEDEVFLRKNLFGILGYRQSKINAQLSAQYAFDDAVEIDRQLRTYNVSASINYQLNEHTSFSATTSFAETEQRGEAFGRGVTETWNSDFGFSRQLGRSLTADLRFSYIDRDGDAVIGFANENIQDRRITFSINYQIR